MKYGLQNGAEEYLRKTNIKGFTYADFQLQYLPVWMERHFIPELGKAADALISYTEPLNSRRERYVAGLSGAARDNFRECWEEYADLAACRTFGVSPLFSTTVLFSSKL